MAEPLPETYATPPLSCEQKKGRGRKKRERRREEQAQEREKRVQGRYNVRMSAAVVDIYQK